MAKTLVTYFSRTGNTKKVAEAITGALQGDKVLLPIDEATDLTPYSLMFVGFPVQSHSVPYQVELFLKRIPAGKKIALFCTHGSLLGSTLSREALEYASLLVRGVKIVGTFSCRGKVSMKALEVLMKSPEHATWAEMAASAATHPDEADLAEARAFAGYITTLSTQDDFERV